MELRGETAVVTGAAHGIGRAIALTLAGEGMNVALLDIDHDALETTAADIRKLGVRTTVIELDLSEREAVERSVATVREQLGEVRVLCSNAAVSVSGHLYEMDPATFDWLMAVNVTGMFNIVRFFIPTMLAHGLPAHVVVTASNSSFHSVPGRAAGAYLASKRAVWGMAQSLEQSLAGSTIGVTTLAPGKTLTNIQQSGRYRPSRFGGPFERADAAKARSGMSAEDVGRALLRAIRDNDPLVVTHPAGRTFLEEQHRLVRDAHDRWARILPELAIDPEMPPL